VRRNLPLSFYRRDAVIIAEELLGKFLVGNRGAESAARRIIDVEVYDGPEDLASHASRGRTPRTEVMFRKGGVWYVYLVYGMHQLLNIVTGTEGYPTAILIRAVEGAEGPGRVGKLFGVEKTLYGAPAARKSGLWIEDRGIAIPKDSITRLPRVGVAYAGAWAQKPLRFICCQLHKKMIH